MSSSIKLVLMLVAGAVADYDGGYSTDFGNHVSSGYSDGGQGYSGGGDHGHGGHEEEHHQGHPYEFGYAVKDPHYGTDFGQNEHSDGQNVKGSYRVVLPDGRTQIVTYHADWKTGFHADVKYEGTAHYPEQSNHHEGSSGGYGGYPSQDLGGHDYTGQDHGGFNGYSR